MVHRHRPTTSIRPALSSRSRTSASTSPATSSRPIRSATARMSSADRVDSSRATSRAPISSTSRGGALVGPRRRQTPPSFCSDADAEAPMTSSRRYSTLPRLVSQKRCNVAPSTGAPRTVPRRLPVSLRESPWSSMRSAKPVVQSASMASGAGSPRAHGRDHPTDAVRHDLVDQRRRPGVQPLSVVDDEKTGRCPVGARQHTPGVGEDLHGRRVIQPIGEQGSDGAERDRGGRPGADDPMNRPAHLGCPRRDLAEQPRLADSGFACDHYRRGQFVLETFEDRLQFGRPADEWPLVHRPHSVPITAPLLTSYR